VIVSLFSFLCVGDSVLLLLLLILRTIVDEVEVYEVYYIHCLLSSSSFVISHCQSPPLLSTFTYCIPSSTLPKYQASMESPPPQPPSRYHMNHINDIPRLLGKDRLVKES